MWLIKIYTRLPGEVIICISLLVEVAHIPSSGGCMWLNKIYTGLPGEVPICISLPVEVAHISLQWRTHVVN